MIIVADTSPLCYLLLIQQIEVLPKIFGEVFIPRQVAEELAAAELYPDLVAWIEFPPAWLKIIPAQRIDPTLTVDPGEAAAISLAVELSADRLLIDDQAGRRAAEERGLNVTGTLGVLDLAARAGLLDLVNEIANLRQTNFHVPESIVSRLIERFQLWKENDADSESNS
jgi:predicted nucleic acid-binding protein